VPGTSPALNLCCSRSTPRPTCGPTRTTTTDYYYTTNYPSAGQYYRVLDIVSTGGNTKSIIRFLNQITSGVAPVETMVVDGSGAVNVKYNLSVVGSLSKGSGSFLIDHPLDPLDKDLKHGFVEAPRELCRRLGDEVD